MRAMVFEKLRRTLMFGGNPGANSEAGSSVAPGAGVRRLPYGSSYPRRRVAPT